MPCPSTLPRLRPAAAATKRPSGSIACRRLARSLGTLSQPTEALWGGGRAPRQPAMSVGHA
eukprot:4780485-Prymnesium_polylepis.1